MNLPFLKKSEPDKNFFLSLLIKPYKVGTILFEEINEKLVILASNEVEISSDIDQISADELLQAADKTISSVEPKLPEGVMVEKTIFSLPYDWIEDTKIKDTYLDRLKNVCKSLDLTPIGYLTSIEAIIHFVDKKEGAPVSAVFIEITKNRVFAYVVKAGKIIAESSETVTGEILETAETVLKKMVTVDVMPARIILLDLENSEEVEQQFLSHKWNSSIAFLHVPQVEVLEKGFEDEAVVNGVATQMELEVLSDGSAPSISKDEAEAPVVATSIGTSEPLQHASSDDFGFMKGEDIAKVKEEAAPVVDDVSETSSTGEFENVTSVAGAKEIDVNYFKEDDMDSHGDEEVSDHSPKIGIPLGLSALFAKFKTVKIPSYPKFSLPQGSGKNKIIIAAVGIIGFLVIFSFIYYNFLLHANVIVFSDQRAIDKSSEVTFSPDPSGDNAIKMTISSEEVKGTEDKNATGKKETGDKAKGSVTIYNKTEAPKTFEKGTTVVGPNSLEFVTTDDLKIASTSSFSTNLSSASVKVEAAKFGKEYNIPSGSNFTVKGFSTSDYIAKNSDATSGGSSKTTTVVSKKDLTDLSSLLIQKLQSDAISKAQSEAGGDEVIFPDALSSTIKDQKFSKKENEESSNVSLSATVVYDIGKYNKNDVEEVVKKLSKNEVPGTYVLQEGESKVKIEKITISKDGESASATLKVNAVYSPQIESQALATEIAGKSQSSANEKVKGITGVSDVNIQFKNKVPLLPAFLPFNSKNITIEIKH